MATKERTITLPAVRKVAATLDPSKENPKNIMAWGNGRPCCIAGNILRACGAPLPGTDSFGQSIRTYQHFARERGWLMTDGAREFLAAAQDEADCGETWGTAIKAGNRAVAR